MPKLAVFPKGFFDEIIRGDMSLVQWLELASELEVDGVELYPKFFKSFDAAYIAQIAGHIRRLGLEMPMLCHSPDFTHPDAEFRVAQVAHTRRMIGLVRDLGGRYCRVLSGQRRPNITEAEGIGWVVSSLESLLPTAESAGIILTIENHYKDGTWEHPEFAQSHARFLAILDRIPSPWLQVQYDPSNAVVAGEDPYELLGAVVDRVATVHASDRYLEGGTFADLQSVDADPHHGYAPFLKHGVIGEGLNDYDRIFSTLAAAGFNGWISIEDGEGPTLEEGMRNLARSAAFLTEKIRCHFAHRKGVNGYDEHSRR